MSGHWAVERGLNLGLGAVLGLEALLGLGTVLGIDSDKILPIFHNQWLTLYLLIKEQVLLNRALYFLFLNFCIFLANSDISATLVR